MKKILIGLLLVPLLVLTGCNTQTNTSDTTNIDSSQSDTTNKVDQNIIQNTAIENTSSNEIETLPSEDDKKNTDTPPTEIPLSNFSTQIKSSSTNRLNNIQLACSELNDATVNNGQEFSFYGVVGPASEAEGYKKADVIISKKVVQALGGGMCQVSSTLYNAVLEIPNIQITERHAHQKPVNYVEQGKDAAVSYGSQDFKFINNTGKNIKIYANADNGYVNISIVSLE